MLRREQDLRAAAEAASRAKDEFLAMLGHELRNPLGAIANASRLLDHPRIDPQSSEQARAVISRQVEHLARLTDDLLDAGRAIMGKIVLERRALDLAAVVARALDTLAAAERFGAHRLERELQPVWVYADETRVEQIVANLVGNALKFTPPGGTISVSVAQAGADAVLSRVRYGHGHVARAAGAGVRALRPGRCAARPRTGRSRHRPHPGAAPCGAARRHRDGGERRTGPGSAFTVRLPAMAAPAKVPSGKALHASPQAQRDILIVEDNADAADTLRRLLELSGHRVRVARDGVAGLEALLSESPQIALVDVGLPRMDGYELARRLRAGMDGRQPPFMVAVTGYGLPEDRERRSPRVSTSTSPSRWTLPRSPAFCQGSALALRSAGPTFLSPPPAARLWRRTSA